LKELFIGAVTWHAHPQQIDKCYLRDLGMFTCFVQARALYEFFNSTKKNNLQSGITASAADFTSTWKKPCDSEGLYSKYMASKTPAQKSVFHLVYGRSKFSGGTADDESDHLKSQVLNFANDVKRLTREFAAGVDNNHRELVESALARALHDAHELANEYGVQDPLVMKLK
jgi:hypothetical protein